MDPHDALGSPAAGAFIGREREMGMLRVQVEEVLAGHGRLVLLVGEPGIGKTRTAQEIGAYAHTRGMEVLWGRAYEGGGAPAYWPWVQILRGYVHERDPEELLADLGIGAADIAPLVPAVRARLPDLPPPRLDPAEQRFALFDSLTRFFKNAATRRPLLVVLDDLHWADPASLLLLQFLAREIADARLAVVGTYRDEEAQRPSPLFAALGDLGRETVTRRIALAGLGASEVARYIEVTAGRAASSALVSVIARETEGNPFFLGEMVRWLLTEGGLTETGDASTPITVPPAVREVIGRRLNRLSAECTRVLGVAAVVGRAFRLDVVARVAGVPATRLLALLDDAAAARVVAAPTPPAASYGFVHALIRETLIGELGSGERAAIHRRIGAVLEALHVDDLEPQVGELAYHFSEGMLAGDVEKAIAYGVRAGDRAARQLAYEEAAEHYERALRALEVARAPRDARHAEILLALGTCRWNAGEFGPARAVFRRAAESAERVDDPERLARAAVGFGGDYTSQIELEEGAVVAELVPFLEKALMKLPAGDSALRAKVTGRLASAVIFSDERDRSVALATEAIEMARRLGDAAVLGHVLSTTGVVTWLPGGMDALLTHGTEVFRIARETGSPSLVAQAHYLRVVPALMAGDLATFDRELAAHERAAESLRQLHHRWVAAVLRTLHALLEGRFVETEALAQEALAVGQRSRNMTAFHAFGAPMSYLRVFQGRADETVAMSEPFAAQYPDLSVIHGTLAWAYAEAGREADARRILERLAINDFADVPRDILWLACLQRLADVVAFLGDRARAARLYELLLPHAHRCATVYFFVFTGSVAHALAVLATTLGRIEAAAQHFESALAVHTRMRTRPWLAYTQVAYARLLLARDAPDDRARARDLLGQAIAHARELGMAALLTLALDADGGAADAAEPDAVSPASAPQDCFRHDGDYWTIAYRGVSCQLKDARGLHYVARLLRHPGRELHVLDLVTTAAADGAPSMRGRRGGAGLPVLDAAAKAAYRRRLADLRHQLEEAEQFHDEGRAARARDEIAALTQQLAAAVGLGGRDRRVALDAERARSTVTHGIRATLRKLRSRLPALADDLALRIKTGTFCVYTPDPVRPIDWGPPDPE